MAADTSSIKIIFMAVLAVGREPGVTIGATAVAQEEPTMSNKHHAIKSKFTSNCVALLSYSGPSISSPTSRHLAVLVFKSHITPLHFSRGAYIQEKPLSFPLAFPVSACGGYQVRKPELGLVRQEQYSDEVVNFIDTWLHTTTYSLVCCGELSTNELRADNAEQCAAHAIRHHRPAECRARVDLS